jgi:ecdysone receptor
VKVSDLGRPKEMSEQVYQIMASMTILVTQLVVEFAKNVPGFSDLERDDQITLLKVSYM